MPGKNKDLIIAKSAGFCPGVKKAIDAVLALAQESNAPIYTLGPLIHNKHVIQTLEEKNVHTITSLDEIKDKKGILVIRAHGITPRMEDKIRSLGMQVVDATCPLVKNVHKVIEKYAQLGYSTVIVGDKGHAEVTGLLGYTGKKGYVVAGPKEAEKLPALGKVNIVAQTTQEYINFEKTAEIICKKSKESVISDTICFPTRQRQKETIELAKNADLMIVVGGKNSANTQRLAKLCYGYCPQTVHIESEKDLDREKIKNAGYVAITAGASTPGWVTERVADYVKDIRKSKVKLGFKIMDEIWEFIIDSGLYSALSAAALAYTAVKLQSIKPESRLFILAGLFVLSLTVINRAWQRTGSGDKEKEWLFIKHRFLSTSIGIILGIGALAVSLKMGTKVFIPVGMFLIFGMIYPARRIFKIKAATAFPASKDIVTALGWAFICSWVAAFYRVLEFTAVNYLTFFYCINLVFFRCVLLGISTVHSDLIVGRETLYKAMGSKNTHIVLWISFAVTGLVLSGVFFISFNFLALALLAAGLYNLICLISYQRGKIPKNIWAETLLDGQFLLLALTTYITS